jgi:hypothetical protein
LRSPVFDGSGPLDVATNYFELTGTSTINISLYDKPNAANPTTALSGVAFVDSNLIPFNPYFILNNDGKYEEQPISITESAGLYPSNVSANPPVIDNLAPYVASQQAIISQSTCSPGIQTCNLFCSH